MMQNIALLSSSVAFPLLTESFDVAGSWLSWLTSLIRILIEGVGVIGVGIILFTLILKAVTLPFDIYQRITTRKQTLIMRKMQPELDKLQKQYANDKQTYSKKMMELYKKNGYSMFSACLPMIISMLILIFAFQSLNEFSQQANLNLYKGMMGAYNQAVITYTITEEEATEGAGTVTTETRTDGTYKIVKGNGADKFLYFEYNTEETNPVKSYKIDVEKMLASSLSEKVNTYYEGKIEKDAEYTQAQACYDYLAQEIGGVAAAQYYHDNPPSFLWIKNIWYPDVSYESPIQDYDSFISSINEDIVREDGTEVSLSSVLKEDAYNNITSKLTEEKDQANGYFILIVLSIGMMVLSQFITMKSSKEASKYQSVDGSGVGQQKMMMIMMPLIYAVFAFMYSAAFSIYMTMSSIIMIIVTLLSNLIIGKVFAKKEAEEFKKQNTRTLPWKERENKKNKRQK